MKKISALFLATLIALTQIGCNESDYSYTSYYEYRNDSSSEIHLTSYNYIKGELAEDPDYSFVIPVGESHTLRFATEGGYPYPFMWRSPTGADYITVINGVKIFVNTRYSTTGEDMLFREDSYEIIKSSKKGRNRTYQYVLTDRDFQSAQPLTD